MSSFIGFAKEVLGQFKKDNVTILASSQAYYYMLSIVPLLFVCFAIIPYLNISPQEAMNFIYSTLPSEMASLLRENIVSIVQERKGGLLTIGILGALWSASNGINAFIKASNEAYEVDETRNFLVVRGMALILTIGMILSLVVAILLPIMGNAIIDFVNSFFGISETLLGYLQFGRWIIAIVVITAILLLLYRFAPNKKLPFKHIIPGAITASILWLLISLAFSFYISHFGNYSATYGSIGGIIILMIWFFLTGLILMIGAEVNAIYHRRKNPIRHENENALEKK